MDVAAKYPGASLIILIPVWHAACALYSVTPDNSVAPAE
jgi:hypothetical protein